MIHILPWIAITFVFLGTIFIFIASVGMLRMPDLLMRMHAATKAGTLGTGLLLIGITIYFIKWRVTLEASLTLIFIFMTAPIASHLIARAAYFANIRLSEATFIDEFKKYHAKHLNKEADSHD